MKIALLARSNLFTQPGGDTIQIQQTQLHLQNTGHQATIYTHPMQILAQKPDLLHFFNLGRPEELLGFLPRFSHLPLVVSAIYVDYSATERFARQWWRRQVFAILGNHRTEYLKTLARAVQQQVRPSAAYFVMGRRSGIQKILNQTQVLVTSTQKEAHRILQEFQFHRTVAHLPLGIASVFFTPPEPSKPRKKAVLCVGRLEPLKNQLRLIEVCVANGWALTLVGGYSPQQAGYVLACKKAGGSAVTFLPHCNQEQLAKLYHTHAVHAGPSFFETFHLASLEALACGCRPVLGAPADAEEIFAATGIFVNPASNQSIEQGIAQAFEQPVTAQEQASILENYQWPVHVAGLVECYATASQEFANLKKSTPV